MKAIVETGYEGFVAQEFIPTREDQPNRCAKQSRYAMFISDKL